MRVQPDLVAEVADLFAEATPRLRPVDKRLVYIHKKRGFQTVSAKLPYKTENGISDEKIEIADSRLRQLARLNINRQNIVLLQLLLSPCLFLGKAL